TRRRVPDGRGAPRASHPDVPLWRLARLNVRGPAPPPPVPPPDPDRCAVGRGTRRPGEEVGRGDAPAVPRRTRVLPRAARTPRPRAGRPVLDVAGRARRPVHPARQGGAPGGVPTRPRAPGGRGAASARVGPRAGAGSSPSSYSLYGAVCLYLLGKSRIESAERWLSLGAESGVEGLAAESARISALVLSGGPDKEI
ncbi:hypothetical protein THAOC_02852, partial [Thalassiosira oceanica]